MSIKYLHYIYLLLIDWHWYDPSNKLCNVSKSIECI